MSNTSQLVRNLVCEIQLQGCGLVTLQNHTQAVKVMQTMNDVHVAGPENPALVIRWAKVRADVTSEAVDHVVTDSGEEGTQYNLSGVHSDKHSCHWHGFMYVQTQHACLDICACAEPQNISRM